MLKRGGTDTKERDMTTSNTQKSEGTLKMITVAVGLVLAIGGGLVGAQGYA